jgi:hypothetical protein
MYEDEMPLSDRVLLTMHNLCLVRPEIAKTGEEIARAIQLSVDHVLSTLHGQEADGYVKSHVETDGAKKFYLTGSGILKVCSSFS